MAEGFGVIPNWLVRDTSISGAAKIVYVVLSSHAGTQGTTWLAHATIAAEAGVSVSTVQRALTDLRALGIIAWSGRRREDGGQSSNMYRLEVATPLGQDDWGVRSEGPTPSVSVTDEEEPSKKNPLRTTLPRKRGARRRTDYTPWFERFWLAYPRKESKQTAARAFEAALDRAPYRTLLEGAERYRDDPNRDPAFTKHPATWLNNDGWLDDALPTRPGSRPTAQQLHDQTMALAASFATPQIGAGA